MKGRIDVTHLNELTDEQKRKLREWWKPAPGDCFHGTYGNDERGFDTRPEEYQVYMLSPYITDSGHYGPSLNESDYGAKPDSNALPLLSINQMIELLQDEMYGIRKCETRLSIEYNYETNTWSLYGPYLCQENQVELVDALFAAVKEAL